jgi:hypothetical protein
MKAYWGSGGIAPLILDLGTRWRFVVSFTPRPLYSQGKSPWYPLDRRLGGPQSRSGRGGEDKIPSPCRKSNPRTPIVQPLGQRYTDWAITVLNLCASPNIIRVIISRSMRWAGHVARTREGHACSTFVGKPSGKRPLGRPRRSWDDNARMDFRDVGCTGSG